MLLEGLALATVWVCLMFWVSLALDVIPVTMGFDELSQAARAILLLISALGLGYILFVWVLRRVFRRLEDRSMALLLERQFGQFDDSLITTVEPAAYDGEGDQAHQELLAKTRSRASGRIGEVRLRQIFNFRPLLIRGVSAVVLFLSVFTFATLSTDAFELGVSRIYGLDTTLWPRRVHIEIVGIKVQHGEIDSDIVEASEVIPFVDGQVKVGKGTTLTLLVRADTDTTRNPKRLEPRRCTVLYRSSEQESGSRRMKKSGNALEGYIDFSLDEKPFKGILSDIEFDVVADDHRLRNLGIRTVDNPIVTKTVLDCDFPEYMSSTLYDEWSDRSIAWTSGMVIPSGTRLQLQGTTNKPITKVYVHDLIKQSMSVVDIPESEQSDQRFVFDCGMVEDDLRLETTLVDSDGVISESPHRIFVTVVKDQAPQVKSYLQGIGSAVTPDVVIPIRGQITDDYGIGRSWVEVQVPNVDPIVDELHLDNKGSVNSSFDFKERREENEIEFEFQPDAENRLVLVTKAEDQFDLADQPNQGTGDQHLLEIVTPDQLLKILERREADLRLRLSQIIDEMTDAKDYLNRVREIEFAFDALKDQELDEATPDENDSADGRGMDLKRFELPLLFAQQAVLQTRKSRQEVLTVAIRFDDIREQLINNRVDSEDRKARLQNEIAEPLRSIANQTFEALDVQIMTLEARLKLLQTAETLPADARNDLLLQADEAVELAQLTISELDEVLRKLIKYETYSELLDIVRGIIDEQKAIRAETERIRKEQAVKDLFN